MYELGWTHLVLDFDDIEINSGNIRELANQYATSKISDIDQLFDFIGEINNTPESDLLVLKKGWVDDSKLNESDFDPAPIFGATFEIRFSH